jgi:SpoVK/Ycf46/Vps4 family AAA+-type ATPase
MDKLWLNQSSRSALNGYLARPIHGLLLSGVVGVGLGTIAATLATQIAGKNQAIIRPEIHHGQKTLNINIDDVRRIVTLGRAKRVQNFVIIIDEAEKFTAGAPQAFLKVLEEPAPNLYFILTSHAPQTLPSTILSRLSIIKIRPISLTATGQLLAKTDLPASKLAQIKFLASGRPAEIQRLLTDEQYFQNQAKINQTAKLFLSGNQLERLTIIAAIKTRPQAIDLATAVTNLLGFMLTRQVESIAVQRLAVATTVLDNLTSNGNIKIQLMYLALNM